MILEKRYSRCKPRKECIMEPIPNDDSGNDSELDPQLVRLLKESRDPDEIYILLQQYPELQRYYDQIRLAQLGPEKFRIIKAFEAFFQAPSMYETRKVLEAHPELLTTETEDLVQGNLEQLPIEKKQDVLFHLNLITRSRIIGIDPTFLIFFAPSPDQLPEVLDEKLLARLTSVRSTAEYDALEEDYPEIIEVIERIKQQIERYKPLILQKSVDAFTNVQDVQEFRRILLAFPELLSEQSASLLDERVKEASSAEATARLQHWMAMLARAREVGVEQVYLEARMAHSQVYNALVALLRANRWHEMRQVIQSHPVLLSAEVTDALEEMREYSQDAIQWRIYDEHYQFLSIYREEGAEAALDRALPTENLENALKAFVDEYSQLDMDFLDVYQNYPEMLTQRADQYLEQLIDRWDEKEGKNDLIEMRELLSDFTVQKDLMSPVLLDLEEDVGDGIETGEDLERGSGAKGIQNERDWILADDETELHLGEAPIAEYDDSDALIDLYDSQSLEEMERVLKDHPNLQEDPDNEEIIANIRTRHIASLFFNFMKTGSWVEAVDYLRRHQVLLELQSETAIKKWIEIQEDEWIIMEARENLRLLMRCRKEGIDKVFPPGFSTIPRERFEQILERLGQIEQLPRTQANLEQALALHERLRWALPRDTVSDLQRMLLVSYGSTLRSYTGGDRAENLERAILAHLTALKMVSKEDNLTGWVSVQYELMNDFGERIKGDRAENQARTIKICREVLDFLEPEEDARMWAAFQNALGNALRDWVGGDREENIEEALQVFQTGLETIDGDTDPTSWARFQNGMGVTYLLRRRGDPVDNIERAIETLNIAFNIRKGLPNRYEQAETSLNLGGAYNERMVGDKSENQEGALTAYRFALETITRQDYPLQWAMVKSNLASLYRERILGERAENLEHAITAAQDALEVLNLRSYSLHWAIAMNGLASSLVNRVRGERAENIEAAIDIYQDILHNTRQGDMPNVWVKVQRNLGTALESRMKGDPVENLAAALKAYRDALGAFHTNEFSIQRAEIEHKIQRVEKLLQKTETSPEGVDTFGNILEMQPSQDDAQEILSTLEKKELQAEIDNAQDRVRSIVRQLEEPVYDKRLYSERISLVRQALGLVSEQDAPALWCSLQLDIVGSYAQTPFGEPSQNTEHALQATDEILRVATKESLPTLWAMTQHNRGNLLIHRSFGDPLENQEAALEAMKSALGIFTPDGHPFRWAQVQHGLGSFYLRRLQGDPAENIEAAISNFQSALKIYDPQTHPQEWANSAHNLAVAYHEWSGGNREENLEIALRTIESVIAIAERGNQRDQLANALNERGLILTLRVAGKRSENLEQAIVTFERALEIHTKTEYPRDWARTQWNLAVAYRQRIEGDRAENLEQAIVAYQSALSVISAQTQEWADIQHNLGVVYRNRVRGRTIDNYQKAIKAYENALSVYQRHIYPIDWVQTMDALATVYQSFPSDDTDDHPEQENIEKAISIYTEVLESQAEWNSPALLAMTHHNLGAVYMGLAMWHEEDNLEVDRKEALTKASEQLSAALTIRNREEYPIERMGTLVNLGGVHTLHAAIDGGEGHVQEAIDCLREAAEIAKELGYPNMVLDAEKVLGNLFHQQGRWNEAYAAYKAALSVLEDTRQQYFSEESKLQLAFDNGQIYINIADTCLQLGQVREAFEHFEKGKARIILDLLSLEDLPVPRGDAYSQALFIEEAKVNRELRVLANNIRLARDDQERHKLGLEFEEKQRLRRGYWGKLEESYPEFVALRRGDPVRSEDIQEVLDGFGLPVALVEFLVLPERLVMFVLKAGKPDVQVCEAPVARKDLSRSIRAFEREVVQYNAGRGDIGQRWQAIAGPILEALLPELEGMKLVYLVPHHLLHYLPLHALQVSNGGDKVRHLIDLFPIAYAPSAAVLNRVIRRQENDLPNRRVRRALVLGYTENEAEKPVFEGEAERVAKLLYTRPFLGAAAERKLLWEKGKDFDTFHFSCHGIFSGVDPLASHIKLADGPLTAYEIMQMNLNADLVTLSACETAVSENLPGDELVGLPRALLYAGASSVLVTLWSVEANSALEIMEQFYRRLHEIKPEGPVPEAIALREAILSVKLKHEHPFYWAPFVLVGDWQ
jgi:CHAT domain-containing protein